MMKNNILALGVVLLMAGVVVAISGASFTVVNEQARWTGTATSDVTEGGNITQGDLNGMSLTDRWAAYFGNVSGSIILGNGTSANYVYTWSVSNASAVGEVCASTGSAYSFAAVGAETAADVNTAFTLGTAADDASNTFTDAQPCNLVFDQGSVATSAYVAHNSSNFWTCAINDGTNTQTKGEMAFCTNITSSGASAYDGTPAQYEIMVPTTPGTGTETYYFYLELN